MKSKPIITIILPALLLTSLLVVYGARKPEDGITLKSKKNEIIRKAEIALNNKVSSETITSIYEVLNKIDPKWGGKKRAFLLGSLAASYPSNKVCLYGQHLEFCFESKYWKIIEFRPLETPTPRQIANHVGGGPVGEITPGTLTLSYTDTNGKEVEVKRDIEINNGTKQVFCKRKTVAKLRDIFGPLPSPVGEKIIVLFVDLSIPLTISISR